jgi:hypothetical protein
MGFLKRLVAAGFEASRLEGRICSLEGSEEKVLLPFGVALKS